MIQRNKLVLPIGVLAVLALAACSDDGVTRPAVNREPAVQMSASPAEASFTTADALVTVMDAANTSLESAGADYRVAIAEYVSSADDGEAGGTVLSKVVGNKQLTSDFVPFDTRRSWSAGAPGATDNITYAIDRTVDAVPPFGGLIAAQTDNAIVRAMGTWESRNCSVLDITRNDDFGLDIGVVAFQNRLGGSPFIFADVQHAGWRDINFAGGILGVTFTFVWFSGGVPTDIDNNGKTDVAFREIYYDPSFNWADNGVANIDVESVALHEAGHGLSQGHFGKVWLKNDGSLKASPRAVMNALYAGPFRDLAGSDNGGHCSNWGSWPNN